jgi:hypothetical protein
MEKCQKGGSEDDKAYENRKIREIVKKGEDEDDETYAKGSNNEEKGPNGSEKCVKMSK